MIKCPQCGSEIIERMNDYERNLDILRCRSCGLSFAVRVDDLFKRMRPFATEDEYYALIGADWRMAYSSQAKLTEGAR